MNLFAIKTQSYSDLITNSSSELFQLKTDKTVEQVSETLAAITEGYREPVLFFLKEYRKDRHKLKEMLDAIRPKPSCSDEEYEQYWDKRKEIEHNSPNYMVMNVVGGWFFDPESPDDIRRVYEDYLCNSCCWKPRDELQTEFLKFIKENKYIVDEDSYNRYSPWDIKEEAFDKFIESHRMPDPELCYHHSYFYGSVEKLDGCILVLSESDNTIPYDTWDAIYKVFDGTNYHLG